MMRFIIIPETAAGKGTGHLVRSIDLACCLPGAELLIADELKADLVQRYPVLERLKLCSAADLPAEGTALDTCIFIVDRPQISEQAILFLLQRGCVVGIDLIGPGLRRIPFVIDLLPRLRRNSSWRCGNLQAPYFLDLPIKQREVPDHGSIKKVLVAFGGEDPAGLRHKLIQSKVIATCLPFAKVDLLLGPRMSAINYALPEHWQVLTPIPRLRDRLHEWDLVLTSFGLTAYEAQAAGCRVVLLNPAPYHEFLSRRDGLPSCGVGKPRTRAFMRALTRSAPPDLAPKESPANPTAENGSGPRGMAQFLLSLENTAACACPACKQRGNQIIARYLDRSFFRCGNCGIVYQQLFGAQTISYNQAYFFQDYEKQYGKTYLDDFDHIKQMGKGRLSRMASHGHARPGERLLDIGCAYGPFLSAAQDCGLIAQGCDISPDACDWVTKNLGIPAKAGDIRQLDRRDFGTSFDLVTLWYVIEHFPDLHRVLAKLNSLLVPGGMLALATPSGEGISARARRRHFFQNSPRDHYSIWRPSQVNRLLEMYGFRLATIAITGHHPERFPGILGKPVLRKFSNLLSHMCGLGDTFELYAIKISDYNIPVSGKEVVL